MAMGAGGVGYHGCPQVRLRPPPPSMARSLLHRLLPAALLLFPPTPARAAARPGASRMISIGLYEAAGKFHGGSACQRSVKPGAYDPVDDLVRAAGRLPLEERPRRRPRRVRGD